MLVDGESDKDIISFRNNCLELYTTETTEYYALI